jgi:hypothetical protein
MPPRTHNASVYVRLWVQLPNGNRAQVDCPLPSNHSFEEVHAVAFSNADGSEPSLRSTTNLELLRAAKALWNATRKLHGA